MLCALHQSVFCGVSVVPRPLLSYAHDLHTIVRGRPWRWRLSSDNRQPQIGFYILLLHTLCSLQSAAVTPRTQQRSLLLVCTSTYVRACNTFDRFSAVRYMWVPGSRPNLLSIIVDGRTRGIVRTDPIQRPGVSSTLPS